MRRPPSFGRAIIRRGAGLHGPACRPGPHLAEALAADRAAGDGEMTQGLSERRDSPRSTPPVAAKTSAGGACLLLEAVRSIVHDTRNRLTGISLCIGAFSKTTRPGSNALAANLASIERSLSALEALCAEFADVEGAISFETAASPACGIVSWYVEFLQRLGLGACAGEVDSSFNLPIPARGVLSRGLIHLARAFWGLHASEITVSCRGGAGSAMLVIAFRCTFSAAAASGHPAVRKAVELVESGGGGME